MKDNMYSMSPINIRIGIEFFMKINDRDFKYIALSNPVREGNICKIKALNEIGTSEDLEFNLSFESSIYVEHLDTAWHQVF